MPVVNCTPLAIRMDTGPFTDRLPTLISRAVGVEKVLRSKLKTSDELPRKLRDGIESVVPGVLTRTPNSALSPTCTAVAFVPWRKPICPLHEGTSRERVGRRERGCCQNAFHQTASAAQYLINRDVGNGVNC